MCEARISFPLDFFQVVDNQGFKRSGCRYEAEPELVPERFKERRERVYVR
jgi:hypothetical protein